MDLFIYLFSFLLSVSHFTKFFRGFTPHTCLYIQDSKAHSFAPVHEPCLCIAAFYPDWVQSAAWQRQWLMTTDRRGAPSSHDNALISLSAQISAKKGRSREKKKKQRERSWRISPFAIKIIKAQSQIANTCPRYLFWIVCELHIADSFPRNRSLSFHFVLSPTLSLHPSSDYVGFFFFFQVVQK